ncbi:MAG: type II secretion system protein [Candidatus Brocadiae bacterium]|nr:type II secretion system protein [Candidatus Brocadiia bacterium]
MSVRRRGFTLIELLVVIAVISLLLAMVSPLLRNAREQARITTCKNNLRQIYFAMHDYAEDYHDKLPDAVLLNSAPNHPRHLHKLLTDYTEGDQAVFQCPSDQGYFEWFGGSVYTAYFGCSFQNRAERRNFQHWVNAGSLPDGNYFEFAGQLVDYSAEPSRLGIVRDGCGWHYLQYHRGMGKRGKAQCLFLDGHVEAFSRERPWTEWARIW